MRYLQAAQHIGHSFINFSQKFNRKGVKNVIIFKRLQAT